MIDKIEITPKYAAELLAVCFVYGNERFIENRGLFETTMAAKKMLNIMGGAEITFETFQLFTQKLNELKNPELVAKHPESGSLMQCYSLPEAIERVEWVSAIHQQFGLM